MQPIGSRRRRRWWWRRRKWTMAIVGENFPYINTLQCGCHRENKGAQKRGRGENPRKRGIWNLRKTMAFFLLLLCFFLLSSSSPVFLCSVLCNSMQPFGFSQEGVRDAQGKMVALLWNRTRKWTTPFSPKFSLCLPWLSGGIRGWRKFKERIRNSWVRIESCIFIVENYRKNVVWCVMTIWIWRVQWWLWFDFCLGPFQTLIRNKRCNV